MVFQLSLYIKRSIPNLYFTKINFLFLTYTKINLVVKEKKKEKEKRMRIHYHHFVGPLIREINKKIDGPDLSSLKQLDGRSPVNKVKPPTFTVTHTSDTHAAFPSSRHKHSPFESLYVIFLSSATKFLGLRRGGKRMGDYRFSSESGYGPQRSGAGTITRVRLENFMCHSSLQIELGEWVNFITGQNGSKRTQLHVYQIFNLFLVLMLNLSEISLNN